MQLESLLQSTLKSVIEFDLREETIAAKTALQMGDKRSHKNVICKDFPMVPERKIASIV